MADDHESPTSRSSSDSENGETQSSDSNSFHLDSSQQHSNWLTVGELIRSIQKPISTYVDEIVKAFHKQLCKDLGSIGKCKNQGNCNEKTKSDDLCTSCHDWLKTLENSHRAGNNPSWHKNCNSARWSEDPWEVAKFFMPTLRSNGNAKEAKSKDLSCLLNVLEWMKDEAFPGRTRVNIDLVRKLRSKVRNTWAHAPKQKLDDRNKSQSFFIATKFLADLDLKFPAIENRNCRAYLEKLDKDGIINVPKSELEKLQLLKQHILDDNASSLPDRLPMFAARETEIENVIRFLMNKENPGKAAVSLHGKPGYGKSAIAIEVSHRLSEDYNVLVIFSQLTTATTVDEMVRRLCSDVGVLYGYDPKSSLIPWLKNVTNKVVFVMDDIDKLLEDKDTFYDFVRWLRMNSSKHCQIVTTSREPFQIPDLATDKVQVDKMDEKSCIQLLKKLCPGQEDEFLQRLADLCGKIPLAMCMVASRVDFTDPNDLLTCLENQPVESLESPEYDQYVSRAIKMSYSKCTDDEKDTLLCFAIFEGSFTEEAAISVGGHKKGESATKPILEKLVTARWIKKSSKHRYSIHNSLKLFLKHQLKGKTEREKRSRAEEMMVGYYLELGHKLTLKTYSKDGYKSNRDALKQEEHHIQNVLNICCQEDASCGILDVLAESEIYNKSAKYFALLARTIISRFIVQNFLERCAKLAEEREQRAIKMNFDCLLIGQERNKLLGKSGKDFNFKIEKLQEEFEINYEDLKQDKLLCADYYYQYGRYLTSTPKSQNHVDEESFESQIEAREFLEKSLKFRSTLTNTPERKADEVFAFLHVGNACKIISKTAFFLKNMQESRLSSTRAQEHYEEAIRMSQDQLGEHELTAACYKSLGDLFLQNDDPDTAEKNYSIAKEMRENLGLDASKRYVCLLNNLGICLTKLKRENEAIEVLKRALDRAGSLTESEMLHYWMSQVHKSLASAHDALNTRQRMEWDTGH